MKGEGNTSLCDGSAGLPVDVCGCELDFFSSRCGNIK